MLNGQWLGAKDGNQHVVNLAAGESQAINEGTRSTRVTSYQAMLEATQKLQEEILSETLVSEQIFDPIKGLAMVRSEYHDIQTVYTEVPAKGKVFQQEMQYGSGLFQIKSTVNSQSNTSWNTLLAYKRLAKRKEHTFFLWQA